MKVNPLLAAIFAAGVAFGSGAGYGLKKVASSPCLNQAELPAQAEPHRFSRVEYERLKLGMSLAEAEAILDRGIEASQSTTMATFVWENPDGSKITATFESGKLKNKAQSGLQ